MAAGRVSRAPTSRNRADLRGNRATELREHRRRKSARRALLQSAKDSGELPASVAISLAGIRAVNACLKRKLHLLLAAASALALIERQWAHCASELTSIMSRLCGRRVTRQCPTR